jgi:hypothetical protein
MANRLDPNRCAKMVSHPPHYLHSFQCQRKPGHGPDGKFCKQHAKKIAERERCMTENAARWGR